MIVSDGSHLFRNSVYVSNYIMRFPAAKSFDVIVHGPYFIRYFPLLSFLEFSWNFFSLTESYYDIQLHATLIWTLELLICRYNHIHVFIFISFKIFSVTNDNKKLTVWKVQSMRRTASCKASHNPTIAILIIQTHGYCTQFQFTSPT